MVLTLISGLNLFCFRIASTVFAVPAEKGQFIILGKGIENDGGEVQLVKEIVNLRANAEADSGVRAEVISGRTLLVVDKIELETGIFYLVSTIGREGGQMGWITEEYIYEITDEPSE